MDYGMCLDIPSQSLSTCAKSTAGRSEHGIQNHRGGRTDCNAHQQRLLSYTIVVVTCQVLKRLAGV